MATVDKYEPLTGGFRALLGFTPAPEDLRTIIGVGLDANGRIVRGAGNTGLTGVVTPFTVLRNPGDAHDVMQDGELVECEGLAAGTRYYLDAAGLITATPTPVSLGHTVEADRLVVRFGRTIA